MSEDTFPVSWIGKYSQFYKLVKHLLYGAAEEIPDG